MSRSSDIGIAICIGLGIDIGIGKGIGIGYMLPTHLYFTSGWMQQVTNKTSNLSSR